MACTISYGWRLGYWPWDVDELSSLEEMGLLDPEIRSTVYAPESIVVRLPRLVPVWYGVQRTLLRMGLPRDEWGTRVLSAGCGILAVLGLYVWGWHWRGALFAAALALLAGASPLVLWLSQQNRFYTMALLWTVAAMGVTWHHSKHWAWWVLAAVFTLLAILTHNVVIVLFGVQAAVVTVAWLLGGVRPACALRAMVCGGIAAGVYGVHVRPIAGSWTGVGFTWALPGASFVAHVGMPTVALALLGSWIALTAPQERRRMGVWAGMTGMILVFVALLPWLMPVWNPRYSLLWIFPLWVTGALAMEIVAGGMLRWRGEPAEQTALASDLSAAPAQTGSRAVRCAGKFSVSFKILPAMLVMGWYGCVGFLLAPKWASHWIDGTRHDYRQAAQWTAQYLLGRPSEEGPLGGQDLPTVLHPVGQSGEAESRSKLAPDAPILTNMELQTRYYLPKALRPQCRYWVPTMPLPERACVVILGGNGWEGPLEIPGRTVQWLASVGRRRFDELSHVVRIYRVGPAKLKPISKEKTVP